MKRNRPPLGERLVQGLKDGIQAAKGERTDLVESWIDLDSVHEAIQSSVHVDSKTDYCDEPADVARTH